MACDISLGRLEPCKSVGGLKAVYFINYDTSFYKEKVLTVSDEVEDLGAPFNLLSFKNLL